MKLTEVKRSVISLVALLIAYWVYATLLVPIIEPPIRKRGAATAPSGGQGARLTDRYLKQLVDLFGADGWENQSPTVLLHRNTLLLFQDYQPRSDGTLELTPCTVVLWQGDGDVDRADTAIVLQAPEGAVLQLSKPLDPRGAQLGQPLAGRLRGPIRIRSRGDDQGKGRLNVLTSDVQINGREHTLWTPNDVQFEYEGHHARGRDLMIKLTPPSSRRRSRRAKASGWAGIQSVEMVRLDHLHLEIASDEVSDQASTDDAPLASSTPVDIACQGPLKIDFIRNLLTLEERVQLRRQNPSGAADTLQCERLELAFAARPPAETKAEAARPDGKASPDPEPGRTAEPKRRSAVQVEAPRLEVTGVVAEGNPVVLDAESRDAQVKGRRLSYDLKRGRFWLTPALDDAADRVWLRFQQQELLTRSLDCRLNANQQIQRVQAEGPGELQGMLDGAAPQAIHAAWHDRLVFEPDGELKHLSLARRASVRLGQTDAILADILHVWFEPAPALPSTATRAAEFALRPQRLLALADRNTSADAVVLKTRGVEGRTLRLDARFRHVAPQQVTPQGVTTREVTRNQPRTSPSSTVRPASIDSRRGNSRDEASTANPSLTTVAGQQLFVTLRTDGHDVTVEHLELERNVQVVRTVTPGSTGTGFRINASAVRIDQAEGQTAVVRAVGTPVVIDSDRMRLETNRLNLDQSRNLVWTEQPGRMTLQVERDTRGGPLPQPQMVTIDWARHMDFDGLHARFVGDVEVLADDQRLRAAEVDVVLNQRVGLAPSTRTTGPIDLQQLRAQGNVHLDSRELQDERVTAMTYMQVPFVQIDRHTGNLLAGGPGRVVTVREGFRGGGPLQSPATAKTQVQAAKTPDGNEKTFLQIDYQKEVTGNIDRRIVHFHERVKVMYGPVQSWNETLNPNARLRADDVLLSCEQLTVAQSPLARGEQAASAMELIAQGNTYVEGETFTARGQRVSYDQIKGLLILEGAGNSDAVLSHQARIGASRSETAARKILFWPDNGRVEVDSARNLFLEF